MSSWIRQAPRDGTRRPPTPASPFVVGAILLMAGIVAVVLSYNASRGLPFVPTYEVRAEVRDAAELVAGSSEVRLGGSRVGIVKAVEAVPARGGRPVHAVLTLALEEDQAGLPADSTVQVRPRSILGAKFVDLVRGTSSRQLPTGGVLPLRQSIAGVQLDEAFDVFGPRTRRAIQRAVSGLGDALAGRGGALNDTVLTTRRLLPPLSRTLRALVSPRADLRGFVRGAAGASRALAPVAADLAAGLGDGARTARALRLAAPQLDRGLVELPRAAAAATRAVRGATPALGDAAAVAEGLAPGARELRPAGRALTRALRDGTPALAAVPAFGRRLDGTLRRLRALARDPHTTRTLRRLTTTVRTLDGTLDVVLPAQLHCNVLGVSTRNLSEVLAVGDAQAPWLNFLPILDLRSQLFRQASPSPNLHANPVPRNDATECETGNEPFLPGLRLGNPEGLQPGHTVDTKVRGGGR
ncbi:MlaD family protein [Conexibacter sp. SYSU D00693]|uniref:MlaD family protein n=1 Tax=Conexibacter sp. SYSU D00693 TaxID=2812560 RepID=UPI00196AFB28|nr:MlaD family protein [Conexibacter sp. SYSU D00693]